MSDHDDNAHLSIAPDEDAGLPVLEAEIEREWRQWRRSCVKDLVARNRLKERVRETALWCVRVLDEYQNRGLGADQGREAIRALINPDLDQS